jgi:hypothetical protein
MYFRASFAAAAMLAGLAACDQPVTAPTSAETAAPALNTNQAPVANIKLVSKKPMSSNIYGTGWYFRYDFNASGSYDPEGGAVTYYWASSCVYVPNGTSYATSVDVRPDDTCLVDLYVTDALGATGHDQVTVDSFGDITY